MSNNFMNLPAPSHWKARILLLAAVLIMAYGVWDLICFVKSPYLGIYGDLASGRFVTSRVVNLGSSEPLELGTQIVAVEGVAVEEWVRSFFRLPPRAGPLVSVEKPLELKIQEGLNLSRTVLAIPRDATLEDFLRGPFWLWSLATFILFCGGYLLCRYPEQKRVQILSLLLLATALSIVNNAGKHLLLQISPRLPLIITLRLGTLCVIFSSWLYLILVFLERRGHLRLPMWTSWMTYGMPPLLASIAFLSAWHRPLSGIEISSRILYLIAGIVVFFTFGSLLHAYLKSGDAVLKAQLKWILWGHTLGMGPYILLYSLPKALIGVPFISYSLSLLPFPLIVFSYLFSFYRYRLMDVDRVIHGSLVYGISVVFLFSFYLVLLGILHERVVVPSSWGSGFRADLLLLLGAALVFNPLKNLVQRGIDRTLFPERLGLPILLMEGSTKLSRSSSLGEISRFLLEDLPGGISVEKAALILRHQFGEGWEFRAKPEGWLEADREIIPKFCISSKESLPLFCDAVSDNEKASDSSNVLKSRGVAIVLPLKGGDDLWGCYLLGHKSTNRLLSAEEVHVIVTLCTQAAHMIGNARLMEGLQRTNRSLADLSHRLIQAEQMAGLGEGAAILAHELKTPLGIVRGSAEILLKAKDLSMKDDVLPFILEEVDRLSGTVDEFLQFARMSPPSKSDTDLNGLVQSAAFLWESRRKSTVPVSI